MAAKSLTDVEVRSLRALSDQRLEIFDAKARDLCLRVTPKQKVIEFRLRGQRQAQAAPPYDRRLSGLDAFRSAREGFGAAQTGRMAAIQSWKRRLGGMP